MNQNRVKDAGKGDGEANILLDISLETVSLSHRDTTADDQKFAYVRAVMEFNQLVLNDYDLVLSSMRNYMMEKFSCKVRRTREDNTSGANIVLEMTMPRSKLVSLQCDHSGGSLREELQRRLVTRNIQNALGVDELTITLEIRSAS